MKRLICMYLVAIILANLIVTEYGPKYSIACAFLFIGLDLTSRDKLHDMWQVNLFRNMSAMIVFGSFLSYIVNRDAHSIAVASAISFFVSASADTLVYNCLHRYSRFTRINGSNVVSSITDSITFPVLAFGFPALWSIIFGQMLAKIIGGYLWSKLLWGSRSIFIAESGSENGITIR